MSNTVAILGFDVSTKSVMQIVSDGLSQNDTLVINTLNPHSYVEQKTDSSFRQALLNSDVLVPDGSGIVFAANALKKVNLKKVAGFDLFKTTMEKLNESSGRVFFLGSTDVVLEKITVRASLQYKNVTVETFSPPFKSDFDELDIKSFAERISGFRPDVVFVGLTAPKQEKLIELLRHKADAKYYSGIGAVFDFYAGTVKRPARFWVSMHMEWLVRLIGEPRRLWRRNFVSSPIFLKDIFISKFMKR